MSRGSDKRQEGRRVLGGGAVRRRREGGIEGGKKARFVRCDVRNERAD